jgi:hypothetical protein
LAVQQTLFTSFGRTRGIIESVASLTTLVLAFLPGHNPVIAALIAFAALCLAAMPLNLGPTSSPINKRVMQLTANELPDDWQTPLRDRWGHLHAIPAVLAFASLSVLILACLLTASAVQAR